MDTLIIASETKYEVNNMALDPIQCHCRRCHQEWKTREKKPGHGHREPPKCGKDNCKSGYWRTLPEIAYEPGFNPFTSKTSQGKLVFKKQDGSLCAKCFIAWAKEMGYTAAEAEKMLASETFEEKHAKA